MTRIITAQEAHDLLLVLPDTDVEAVSEESFFHEHGGNVEFHRVRYTDGRVVDRYSEVVGSCVNRQWADLAATAPDLAYTVVQQAEQIKRLQAVLKAIDRDLDEDCPAGIDDHLRWGNITAKDIEE